VKKHQAHVTKFKQRERSIARSRAGRIAKAIVEGRALRKKLPVARTPEEKRQRRIVQKRTARLAKAAQDGRVLTHKLKGLHSSHVQRYAKLQASAAREASAGRYDAHVLLWKSDRARYNRWKYHHITGYAMYHRLKRWVHKHLGGNLPSRKWAGLLGYTADDLRAHIERQFLPRMGWHNKGEWHIDHITPVSAFQRLADDESEFIACFGLSNLRPVWGKVNLRKGARREFLI
jgi:hypothetical protein